jgi:hypothetical protein
LVFLSTTCPSCRNLARQMSALPADILREIVVYCRGSQRACEVHMAALFGVARILRGGHPDLGELFQIQGYPASVIIESDWTVSAYQYSDRFDEFSSWLTTVHSSEIASLVEPFDVPATGRERVVA